MLNFGIVVAFISIAIVHINSAVFDICVRYADVKTSSVCLECMKGFYIKAGQCNECKNVSDSAFCDPNYSLTTPSNISKNLQIIQKSETAPQNISQKLQLALAVQPSTQINVSQNLQNCKTVDKNSICTECFTGYQFGPSSKKCLKITYNDTDSKMVNCFVFSEVANRCLMCEQNFVLNEQHVCKNRIITQNISNIVLPNTSKVDVKFAQADNLTKLPALQVITDISSPKIFSAPAPAQQNAQKLSDTSSTTPSFQVTYSINRGAPNKTENKTTTVDKPSPISDVAQAPATPPVNVINQNLTNSSITINKNNSSINVLNKTANQTKMSSTSSSIQNKNETANSTVQVSPSPNKSQNITTRKYNVTTYIDKKTNFTITIIGTTLNPPTTLPNCVKYRDISYECVQCQSGYSLYKQRCYVYQEYMQVVKNARFYYNQLEYDNCLNLQLLNNIFQKIDAAILQQY